MIAEEGRTCNTCEVFQKWENFASRSDRPGKRRTVCKECKKIGQKIRYSHYKKTSFFKYKIARTRSRSQSLGVPFDLDIEYLENIWTGICPVTGLKLDQNAIRDDETSPELDRFNPDLGYIKGNVHFLSRKINRIKNNVSTKELRQLLVWMEKIEYDTADRING